jgi:hemin uptake protein HemP
MQPDPTERQSEMAGAAAAALKRAGRRDETRQAERAAPVRVLLSEDVLGGDRSVEIVHAGNRYRLSVTSTGKLILTK